ncbi:hypothetical protein BDN70DRAFT_875683, partial [Pholiota conissans]
MHTHTNTRRHTTLLSVYIPSGFLAHSLSVPAPLLPPKFRAPPSLHFLVFPLPPCTQTIQARQNKRYPTFSFCLLFRLLPYSLFPISIYTSSHLRSLAQSMHPNYRQTRPHTPTRSAHALGLSRHIIFRPVSGHRLLRGSSPSMTPPCMLLHYIFSFCLSFFLFLARASLCVSQCAPVVRVDCASSSPLLSPYLTPNHVSALSPSVSKGAFFAVSSAAGIVIVSVSHAICFYSYFDDMALVSLAYRTSGCEVYC